MRNFMEKIKNPDLFKKIRDYQMEYLPVFRKKSINSNKSAVSTMNIFIDFLVTIKKRDPFSLDFSDFGSKSINDFIKYQKEEKKLAPTTINLRLSNLRSFNYYLYKRNYISLSEFSEIQEIKQMPDFREKELTFLQLEEIEKLLKLPDSGTRFGLRDKFYLTLLYETGCRDNEILGLKVRDFEINPKGYGVVHILGKGNKYRVTPVLPEIIPLYKAYMSTFHENPVYDRYLFYAKHKNEYEKMSDDNAERIVEKYEKLYHEKHGELQHIHPHIFRHTRAMHLYEAGVPLPTVSDWLGHSDIETTIKYYAQTTMEMKLKAMNKLKGKFDFLFSDTTFSYADNLETLKKLCGLK